MADARKLVLVVDDDPAMRRLLTTILARDGSWTVDEAKTGAEAMEKVAAARPAVIVLDMLLPDMSGLDLIERLRGEGGPEPAVVAITAAARSATPDAILHTESSVREVLRKPVEPEQLLAAVRAACD
ncbi:MAG TPA: response regulator [Thermoanaerobaculia bacterium]|nr:response regulator [Thermoanaerobaculia bacterium]